MSSLAWNLRCTDPVAMSCRYLRREHGLSKHLGPWGLGRRFRHICSVHGHKMAPPDGLYECTEIEDVLFCVPYPSELLSLDGFNVRRRRHPTRVGACR